MAGPTFSAPPGVRLDAFTQLFDPDRARFQPFCDAVRTSDAMEQVGADIARLIAP